jgi:hypothetical protein
MHCWAYVSDVFHGEERGTAGDRIILKTRDDLPKSRIIEKYIGLLPESGGAICEKESLMQALALVKDTKPFMKAVRSFIPHVSL